jgi:predicted permease
VSPQLVLILLGLVTQAAVAILCYRVAEARRFNRRLWAAIGFLTGIFGLLVLILLRGPAAEEGDPQA